MTTGRYAIARLALAFGISRRQKRMGEAATEAHLLREAEQYLGELIWTEVEEVEELGIEYWNLRRLSKKRDELTETLEKAEEKLRDAHDERTERLSSVSEKNESLMDQRTTLVTELEALARKRDTIVARAREVRRVFDGVKAKLEVLQQDADGKAEEVTKAKSRLKELRGQFDEIKAERDSIAQEVESLDKRIDGLDKQIDTERKTQREDTAGSFHVIGDMNREISRCKAEIGVIVTEMQQLYGEIGRHVSLNFRQDDACRRACAKQRPMVEVMSALRRSILLNHRLSNAS
ncbi:hypothetical protein [Haloferula sargassicola]|uniref:Chromosome partition protein Smc n=1 Tax=Haloferula sargassicola TaxID=490096 RepID=A0ABP9UK79_9BACT